MPATRSSARQAAGPAAGPSPNSSQGNEVGGASGSKRKGAPGASPKAKRGKKEAKKEQTTLEETMPREETQDQEVGDKEEEPAKEKDDGKPVKTEEEKGADIQDAEMKDREADKPEEERNDKAQTETKEEGANAPKEEDNAFQKMMKDGSEDKGKAEQNGSLENGFTQDTPGGSSVPKEDDAVEPSSKREESTPSSILEKGIIYFFERGRVGIDEPSSPDEIARTYIVLRPMPHGSHLGEGPIGDEGNNRLLALPKKVLPKSPKDRFMSFVEKAQVSLDDIKTNFGASDYATKTSGTRHTPPMAPLGEGVYAITSTGRESHIAYILTIPSEVSEVQRDIGLQQRGSFITSIKNPTTSGPAAANLPKAPDFPQELMNEFHGRRWMPLQPKFLDYANAQLLIIGHQEGALEKATDKEPEGEDEGKEKPLEEMEKLEDEDQIRIKHLEGDNSVFVDLGLSSQDYPKVQTTW